MRMSLTRRNKNHSGRTYLGSGAEPLGRVFAGAGNDGEDGTEGARSREVHATRLARRGTAWTSH